MKKILVFISMLAMCSFAQQSGNISLIFNGEQIDMPIKKVFLIKDDGIVVSFNAEKLDSNVQQFVALTIGLKKLSPEPDAETFKGTKINIKTKNNKTALGKELSIWFYDDFVDSNNQSEISQYAIYNKGERVSWEINSVSLKIEITELQLENGVMHMKGKFNGEFKSNAAPPGQIAKIEDGEFDIIF